MPNFVAKALGVTNGSKVRAFAGMDRADGPPMALLGREGGSRAVVTQARGSGSTRSASLTSL
jgi:hypothetical protein